ncbi:MAG TPA: hypothetical protein VK172_14750 [Lentimicrobium sp.]|nr:hypothetical protein [Lentimicrobium sp.]
MSSISNFPIYPAAPPINPTMTASMTFDVVIYVKIVLSDPKPTLGNAPFILMVLKKSGQTSLPGFQHGQKTDPGMVF